MKKPIVLQIGGVEFNVSFNSEEVTPLLEDQVNLLKNIADACEDYDIRLVHGLIIELAAMLNNVTPTALMFIAEIDELQQQDQADTSSKTAQTMLQELGINTDLSGLKPKGNA